MHQIVISGFFHADPHGGNILITPDRRVCLLDWGLVGQLTRYMRCFLADLLSAIASQDAAKSVWVASRLSRSNRFIDSVEMEKQITVILRKYQQAAMTGEAVGNLILEMIYVFATNGINIVRDFTLLGRTVVAIESTARTLDPRFSLATTSRPFLKQLARERWNPQTVMKETYRSVSTALSKLKNCRATFSGCCVDSRARTSACGSCRWHGSPGRIAQLRDKSSGDGVIIAATIIGSSMLVAFSERTTLFGMPLGRLGYLISTLMGLWIVIDISATGVTNRQRILYVNRSGLRRVHSKAISFTPAPTQSID
jgi:ubiquinone biosynthesis protein